MGDQQSRDWQRRWKEESGWSAQELAKLCCGWNPGDGVIPDPTDYEAAKSAIVRAVRLGDLQPIDLKVVPATREELFYGYAPFFRPLDAARWAAKRFPAFPYSEADWRTDAPTVAQLTNDDPREALKATRYALLDEYQTKHKIENREELCRKLAIGKSTLESVVRDETKKYGRDTKRKILSALGVSEDEWNRPR